MRSTPEPPRTHGDVEDPVARRSRRVSVLLIGILALSVADLAATLTHLRTIGMAEANPIAAFIIEWGDSSTALSLYKLGTVGLATTVLFHLRTTVQAEIGCWLGLLILGAMSVHWHLYTQTLDSVSPLALQESGFRWNAWLTLSD